MAAPKKKNTDTKKSSDKTTKSPKDKSAKKSGTEKKLVSKEPLKTKGVSISRPRKEVKPEAKSKQKKKVSKPVFSGKANSRGTAIKSSDISTHSEENELEHFSLFSDFDIELFKGGNHYQLYNKLGSHLAKYKGDEGTYFAVWAPNAQRIHLTGDFNDWNKQSHSMHARWDGSGIWEVFIPGVGRGARYKYYIESNNGHTAEKGDPYAFHWQTPPETASVVSSLDYDWKDQKWIQRRSANRSLNRPISVYEMHLGSWRKVPEEDDRYMTYREMAQVLPRYCQEMGFTHVEMMPVMEHPFFGSWGYQITGYFAPSSRFGSPTDFMVLVDALHQAGIGVILDWVPSHYPTDEHGLDYFDGTHLYEHADPRKGFHPDWKSDIFNYGRNEVRAFLISNALYWLDKYHIDGLRVDAVASMLYLDYSREEGEWIPNEYGGRENLEAISLLQEFNEAVHNFYPDVFTVAEESTAYPGVTHPTSTGGLGFDMKWMMGWMHDTLDYFEKEPVYRNYHHGQITFSLHYAFSEKFTLPLSHDEVVYGKHSLINKMPGDTWQQFANLRLLYGYMYGHPGAKMIFMGGEFGQRHEWQHDFSLDWHEAEKPLHGGVQKLVKGLNTLYKNEPALYTFNFEQKGFEWIDYNDASNSVLTWMRKSDKDDETLIFIANFTPLVRENYRIGISNKGTYKEIFNSDISEYGGSGVANNPVESEEIPKHDRSHSMALTLPPLAICVFKLE